MGDDGQRQLQGPCAAGRQLAAARRLPAPQWYTDQNACYANSPTPYMQLISNPPSNLSSVLLNMQFASSAVATVCRYDGYDATTLPLRQQGRQTVGYRFVLGCLPVRGRALQPAHRRPADRPGSFVGPDSAGLKAAAGLLKADDKAHVWELDYKALGSRGAKAPGAARRTRARCRSTRSCRLRLDGGRRHQVRQAALLRQTPRVRSRVAPTASSRCGYLPVTDENGLGDLHDYTLAVVTAVRAQDGSTPALDAEALSADEVCDFSVAPAKPTDSCRAAATAAVRRSSTPRRSRARFRVRGSRGQGQGPSHAPVPELDRADLRSDLGVRPGRRAGPPDHRDRVRARRRADPLVGPARAGRRRGRPQGEGVLQVPVPARQEARMTTVLHDGVIDASPPPAAVSGSRCRSASRRCCSRCPSCCPGCCSTSWC